ncbi:MAG: hypothetical protein KGL39_06210 [Patescibacteria group bacterium]|nr:hypothetical protein [Patescibacteria group bacterium]
MNTHPNRTKRSGEKAVMVTTLHRGVFFGYAKDIDLAKVASSKSLNVRRCRNCISWASSNKGFLGLATSGPNSEARVGPAADSVLLLDVTSFSLCSEEATKAWENAPWSR